jgi:hypothetical protein
MLCGEQSSNSEDFDELHHPVTTNHVKLLENTSKEAAHMLVSSLVSTDPKTYQTFVNHTIHKFFQTGKFPREIPVSALVKPPDWQSVAEGEESQLNWCYIMSQTHLGQKVRAVEESGRYVLCTEAREYFLE